MARLKHVTMRLMYVVVAEANGSEMSPENCGV